MCYRPTYVTFRIFSLFVALSLGGQGVVAGVLHVCQMRGVRLSPCCCMAAKRDIAETNALTKTRTDCCRKLAPHDLANGLREPRASLPQAPHSVGLPCELWVAQLEMGPKDLRYLAPRGPPPGMGPPLYVQICSLLI
jgi:hypothetical protein